MNRASRLREAQRMGPRPDPAWQAAMKVPFLDDSPMSGPPLCTAQNFKLPRLRQCAFEPGSIAWKKMLGGGLDGHTWKVWFGEMGPFVLKIFLDTDPPSFIHYYAAQRECQNIALFQMIEAAIAQAAAKSKPIRIHANPQTQQEALDNLYAFSDEVRLRQSSPESSRTVSITSIPRIRKCYGWLRLSGNVFHALPLELKAPSFKIDKIQRSMSFDREYIALVYEYIEEGRNNEAVVEEVDRFLAIPSHRPSRTERAEY
ncbi:hypothetical protein TOPH_07334 [Tolypocladium ophioglossoides CBS 100239]|uniref:Protein kinase domain-containing protein n=1 Tax=Tolypocladium ophioglossoides (strain CBS 100239) TaxID=1163406 RepID=A0A0L0N2M2_TOLOC|nr:hypothetical protein TOPH_07334 [Tolypocladium ophioglossoides CBS 100239]